MKKVMAAFLLLAGCAGSTTEKGGNADLQLQIDAAQTKMDSAERLLKTVYDTKKQDSIAYEAYDRDGIGSDHQWTHPDTIQSWINKDSALYNKWKTIRDSLTAQQGAGKK